MAPFQSNGSYAVQGGQSWMSMPVGTAKVREKKNKIVIDFPIFRQCSYLTTDPMWMAIFTQASDGKFPRGFMFREEYLIYKHGSKSSRLEIPATATADEVFPNCLRFFKETAGIRSELDELKLQEPVENSDEPLDWKKVPKRVQNFQISLYVSNLDTEYKFTTETKNKLITMINLGFNLGYLTKEDVLFTRKEILSIQGIRIIPIGTGFDIRYEDGRRPSLKRGKSSAPEETSTKRFNFMGRWKSLLDNIRRDGSLIPTSATPRPTSTNSSSSEF